MHPPFGLHVCRACMCICFQALGRVDALHAALCTRNAFAPNADGMPLLALYMKNCPEWVLAEQACFASRGATVPL
jgi:long-chain acyl-CoA synthetase